MYPCNFGTIKNCFSKAGVCLNSSLANALAKNRRDSYIMNFRVTAHLNEYVVIIVLTDSK